MGLEEYSEDDEFVGSEKNIDVDDVMERPILPADIMENKNQTVDMIRRRLESIDPMSIEDIWDFQDNKNISYKDLIEMINHSKSKERFSFMSLQEQETVKQFLLGLPNRYQTILKLLLNEFEDFFLYLKNLTEFAYKDDEYAKFMEYKDKIRQREFDLVTRLSKDVEQMQKLILEDPAFIAKLKDKTTTVHVTGEIMSMKDEKEQHRDRPQRPKREDKGAGF